MTRSGRGVGLSRNQLRMLRAIVYQADTKTMPKYWCQNGNEERTARSLVRLGLVAWDPPGTRQYLLPSPAGREAAK